MDAVYRTLTLRGATGKLRAARLHERDYLVVPVTALVEAVIHPLGSKGRGEFVSRKVLKQSVDTWNGRPCVPDHPMDAQGNLISANLPAVFEQQSFGMTFNAAFENDKELHMEAWLDPVRAEMVGAHAMDVIDKVRNDQPVEVSVGGYVRYVESAGSYNGQEYGVEWLQVTSDHLALGLRGARGACSVDMGCGAMRGNAESPIYVVNHNVDGLTLTLAGWQDQPRVPAGESAGGQWTIPTIDSPMSTQQVASLSHLEQWRAKVSALLKSFSFRANMRPEDMSDGDLRELLQAALAKDKTGYCQVVSVYPEQRRVVFVQDAEPQGMGDIRWYQQDFSVSKDGKIALEAEAKRVRPVQTFEVMAAETPPDPTPTAENENVHPEPVAAAAECGCQNKQEPQMHRNADKIKALIEDPKTPFTADDQAFLEGLADDRLAAFAPKAVAVETPAAPVAAPVTPTPTPEPVAPRALTLAEVAASVRALNETEFLDLLPPDARQHVIEGRANAKARREKMLAGLKAATKDAYSDAELAGMSGEQLDKLAKAVGFDPDQPSAPAEPEPAPRAAAQIYDWTGMGGARRVPDGTNLADYTPPDPYADALKARKGA